MNRGLGQLAELRHVKSNPSGRHAGAQAVTGQLFRRSTRGRMTAPARGFAEDGVQPRILHPVVRPDGATEGRGAEAAEEKNGMQSGDDHGAGDAVGHLRAVPRAAAGSEPEVRAGPTAANVGQRTPPTVRGRGVIRQYRKSTPPALPALGSRDGGCKVCGCGALVCRAVNGASRIYISVHMGRWVFALPD